MAVPSLNSQLSQVVIKERLYQPPAAASPSLPSLWLQHFARDHEDSRADLHASLKTGIFVAVEGVDVKPFIQLLT